MRKQMTGYAIELLLLNFLIICFISKIAKTESFDLFHLKLQQYRSSINRYMGLSQKWKPSRLIVLYLDKYVSNNLLKAYLYCCQTFSNCIIVKSN